MTRGRAFKPEFRLDPPRSGTPPPPLDFIEPLSPLLPSGAASYFASGNTQNSTHILNGIAGVVNNPPMFAPVDGGHVSHRAATASHDVPFQPAPLQQSNASPALGSPIDALANAAVSSLATSPVYADHTHRPSFEAISPTTTTAAPLFRPTQHITSKHSHPDDTTHTFPERPTKRARSEFFPSPHSRPVTSHIPPNPWSYNVEQMVDSVSQQYQEASLPATFQEDSSSKRYSDAQLLLFFHQGASRPPSYHPQAAHTKIRSFSHADTTIPHTSRPLENGYSHPAMGHPEAVGPNNAFEPVAHSHNTVVDVIGSDMKTPVTSAVQTHTPPEESADPTIAPVEPSVDNEVEAKKPKRHQGWPKGKPRGPRTGQASGKKKKIIPKSKPVAVAAAIGIPEQLQSPQSLPTETADVIQPEIVPLESIHKQQPRELTSDPRRHSLSSLPLPEAQNESTDLPSDIQRARSVPLHNDKTDSSPTQILDSTAQPLSDGATQITICVGCNSSSSLTLTEERQQWISCDGCKGWFHFACAGFKNEREVRDVDKFFCVSCSPQFGTTTRVRKSTRAHTAVDYAGLNEGIVKTSDDNPEHHYIAAFKNGDIQFTPELFARVPPEYVTADYLEKTNGFKEPIVIPATLNPRPKFPGLDLVNPVNIKKGPDELSDCDLEQYELVQDVGQDKIDMVIPEGLTVRRVAEMYGPTEKVDVIDVKVQEGEDKRWTMAKWADYYEEKGEKPIRNVISLEVSQSKLGRLIRRPRAVRDMDLQDSIWPEEDKINAPKVQFYCLMSVADCYTDFHIDFGGSSVYYHIIKGKKTFFFIRPTKQNLKKYEDWCLSPRQSQDFLGHQVKECYRVDLSAGDTMLIPSGWIHAVWTPEDSLVIGGNFLTRIHYGMQISVAEVEKNTKVAKKFRYPFFQKIMWLAVLKYLEEDPLPQSVVELFRTGGHFRREVPIYCQPNNFGHNSMPGPGNYNARYYSKAELDGLPELVKYIWRTVLISLGRVEGITVQTCNAVAKSIPKGRGEPLTLARNFAMWTAWKRGDDTIPDWAHPDFTLPEAPDSKGEKKLSAAQIRRMERDSWSEAYRAARARQSPRTRGDDTMSPARDGPILTAPAPSPLSAELGKHLTTPKTSQLGPKRIACDACRKRRIRCKHKEDLLESSKGDPIPSSPLSKTATAGAMAREELPAPLDPVVQLDGEPDAQIAPRPVSSSAPDLSASTNSSADTADSNASKSGRAKACADCRKSKRRCIHDENGNVDPVKASEAPIPRGSASKKRRISEGDPDLLNERMQQEQTPSNTFTTGDEMAWEYTHNSQYVPDHLLIQPASAPEIQESIAVVPHMKAREQSPTDDIMLVDDSDRLPEDTENVILAAPLEVLPVTDGVVSSIEDHPEHNLHESGETAPHVSMLDFEQASPSRLIFRHHSNNHMGRSSPLTDLARSASPDQVVQNHDTTIEDTMAVEMGAQLAVPQSTEGEPGERKQSTTPRPLKRKASTPKSAKKGNIKLEHKTRVVSTGVVDEDLRLALQLQQEEHGLRRRSK
ncbi:hypothetical protein GQ43DRAFT_483345 [Delitschia confertaspora ATCC 74209]|uniref:JmjC domain-containing histone demethylation protein 1 n=1 Tax=Delitschia confertaspora ATCC 74209 TaxID=1513339 RepID=A0A9P4MMK2_9PLEO|nr:hypothetical protein GQ43DRAFT_483345 [Delitschia confertaspora ATCC 74209]